MRIFLGFFGWIAKISGPMSRSSVNGMPGNWGVIIFGSLGGFFFAVSAIDNHSLNGWLAAIPCFLLSAVFLVSSLLKHVIFQRTPPSLSPTSGQPFS